MNRPMLWTNGGQDAEFLQELLLVSLKRSGVGAIMKEAGGRYMLVANLPDCWKLPADRFPTHRSVFGEEFGRQLEDAAARSAATDNSVSLDVSLGSGDRHFTFFFERVLARRKYYLLVTIVEMTEERRREQRLKALLRELSHRSKNLLAIVLSIAAHTARTSTSLPVFSRRFSGRIFSMSRSQDLVTDAGWRGAFLHDLVKAQAGKYVEQPHEALRLVGLNPLLDPNEALHVGLAVHELFVDAMTLGDNESPLPLIELSCNKPENGAEDELEVVWKQQNPPASRNRNPAENGEFDTFGSAVLNRITPVAIGGEGDYFSDGDTTTYRLRFRRSGLATQLLA